MCENNEGKKLNLEGLEGLRGDGEAKWYVVHTYSGQDVYKRQGSDRMISISGR